MKESGGGTKKSMTFAICEMEVQYATRKRRTERTPRLLPPNQGQRHRQEVRADNLDPRLVRVEGQKLYLLPVQGSGTQWYQNVLRNPSIRLDARGVGAEFRATPMTDAK